MLWHPDVANPTYEGLYAIVDVPHPHGLSVEDVTRAILGDRPEGGKHGASLVQLRAKHATTEERKGWLRAMAPICHDVGVALVCNDDVEAAMLPEVDGLHLGQEDDGAETIAEIRSRRDDLFIGLSTHDLTQLRDAQRQQPDYLAFGPVANTSSKENPDPIVGLSGLADAGRVASKPLVAIGGLDQGRAAETIRHGARMAAVIGALARPNVEQTRAAAIELAKALENAARPLSVDEVAELIPVLERDLLAELAKWGDSLSVHLALELPARFSPRVVDGEASYRYCEVLDLIHALGKRPHESWEQWRGRGHGDPNVVQLRRPR